MSTQQQTVVLESIASEHNNDDVSTITDMSDEIFGIYINDQFITNLRNGLWVWYVHEDNPDVKGQLIFFTSVSRGDNALHLKRNGETSTFVDEDEYSETFRSVLKQIADNTA